MAGGRTNFRDEIIVSKACAIISQPHVILFETWADWGKTGTPEFTNSRAYTKAAPVQQREAALRKLIHHKVALP